MAIVGVGLIGGSIALSIKKMRLADKVIGVSRHKRSLAIARRIKAIDEGSQDINIIKDADLVILALPVSAILKSAPRILKIIKKGCVVTDVGSTKMVIVSKLERIFPRYIGGHPLAGSEKRGIINADAEIFKDSLCVLTPTKKTDKEAQRKVGQLWRRIGARVIFLTPAYHDKILSFISHLPHLIAFSLIAAMPRKYLRFASSGLRDTTRIAASDAGLWRDIFLSNQKNMSKAIELFQKDLLNLKSAIEKKDARRLGRVLKQAKNKRDSL